MNGPAQTDAHMMEAIRKGDAEAWGRLVDRYQGRLLRFATARVPQRADAEDIVQETFTAFVRVAQQLQIQTSIETYLFGILRNEIVNRVRTRWARSVCLLQDACHTGTDDANPFSGLVAPGPSVSGQVSHGEQHELQQRALTQAVEHLVGDLQKGHKFRDLKVAELLFYCQLPNADVARLLQLDEAPIRAAKHRWLARLREEVRQNAVLKDLSVSCAGDMLTSLWETERLTCPNRATLGAFLCETLASEWFDYVDFHLTTTGCHFCRASFKDLQEQWDSEQHTQFQQRVLSSTIGFLTRA